MLDFNDKMHQIWLPLGLSPIRPRWGSLQRSLRPLAVFKGPTIEEGRGRGKEEGREREGKGGENDLTHHLSQIPGYATASQNEFKR